MCGIAGIWDFNGKNENMENTIKSMTNTLAHRGPDDAGFYTNVKNNIALGHRRLSIIDLSTHGHQPMSNDNKNIWITYNGEIYNFIEIKKELESLGYAFKSHSDTEVILKSYEEWGLSSVHKFRGMFALAIWDSAKKTLFLLRDRAGVKPLYYYFNKGLVLFASELKALHKHPRFKKEINYEGLNLFLQLGYIPAPHTIFKNTHKVNSGHYLKIHNGKIQEEKYWDINDFYLTKPIQKNEAEIENELERILTESFSLRLISDVPVGVFLSGGIDSTLVTALLQKKSINPLKTFTIGFKEKNYDEAPYAKAISKHLGTDHYELYCGSKESLNIIKNFSEIYDEPFGDSSGIPNFLVSNLARRKVKVALSADGADELFCGYTYYNKIEKLWNKIQNSTPLSLKILSMSPKALISFLGKNIGSMWPMLKQKNIIDKTEKIKQILKDRSLSNVFLTSNSFWLSSQIKNLTAKQIKNNIFSSDFKKLQDLDVISQMQAIDFKYYLSSDILTKVDRAAMAVSLENRDPFLDQNIIEYAAKLPIHFKYRDGVNKYILKKILYKYVPKKMMERPKQGFAVPIFEWFKKDLHLLFSEYLEKNRLKREGIFNAEYVGKNLEQYYKGNVNNINKLWLLLVFQMWREKWMK